MCGGTELIKPMSEENKHSRVQLALKVPRVISRYRTKTLLLFSSQSPHTSLVNRQIKKTAIKHKFNQNSCRIIIISCPSVKRCNYQRCFIQTVGHCINNLLFSSWWKGGHGKYLSNHPLLVTTLDVDKVQAIGCGSHETGLFVSYESQVEYYQQFLFC